MLSQILSRLAVRGGIVASTGTGSATKLPILGSDGKLDPSTYVAGGGGGSGAAETTSFNPVYTNSTLDSAANNVQTAVQEIDVEKLAVARNLTDVASPSTAFATIKVAATTTLAGSVELATQTEVNAGTANGGDTILTGGTPKLVVTPDVAKVIYLNKFDTAGDTMAGPITLPNASPSGDNIAARKKYVDDQITARLTTNSMVPTGKLLWVDSVNGKLLSDGTAPPIRGRLDRPFSRLAEAKTTAVTGDTIVVFPGTYDERNLLKDGVNWYFYPGAKITTTAAVSGAIWDDGASYGSNAAVTCKILGYGEFSNGSTVNNPAAAFNISNSSTVLTVECVLVGNTSSGTAAIGLFNGTTSFLIRDKILPAAGSAIELSNGTHTVNVKTITAGTGIIHNAGNLDITFQTMTVTGYAVLQSSSSGNLTLNGSTISGGTSLATCLELNATAGLTWVKVKSISCGSTTTVDIGGVAKVKFVDSEIINTKVSSTAAAIQVNDGTNLVLKDCDLTVNSSATNCIIADFATTPTVVLHGYNRSNKVKDSAVTFSKGMFELV